MRVSPFNDEPIEEVALTDAPLVKVLVQLRFPTIASVETNQGIASFQAALNERYPVMRDEREVELAVASNAPAPIQFNASVVRRLFNPDSQGWTVSLASGFVALETSEYTSRAEFVDRWREVLSALTEITPAPRFYDRLGVRYINRLVGEDVTQHLPELVYDEVLGVQVLERDLGEEDDLIAAIAQANFRVGDVQLGARWGKLPPNGGFVPGLDPVGDVSWVLDTDVFIESKELPFDIEGIAVASEDAASRAYRFFRWAMTDDFLRRRGGQL